MPPTISLQKLAEPPEWVTKWFADIDAKRFGPDFETPFAPDAEMIFGVHRIRGVAAIKAHLIEFDSTMDTRHVVLDFWEAGDTKFLRGEVSMTKHATPDRTVTPTFVHVWHMSAADPRKIQRMHGAVGPME